MRHSKKASEICVNCQECCKTVGVYSIYPYDKEVIEFYETRGAKVHKKSIGTEEITFIEFDLKCPHLDTEKGCLIYDHRPAVCRTFPNDKNQVIDKCELHIRGYL